MLRPYLQVVNFWAVILNVVQYVEYVLYGRIRLRCHGLTFQMLDPCGASWIKGFAVFLNWRLKFFSSIQQRWMKAFLCPGMPIGNRVIGWIAGSLSTLMGTLVRVKIIWLWSQTGGEWIKWASDASFCSLEFQELKEIMNRTSCTNDLIRCDVLLYPAGLFGSSTFSQPVTSSTSSGFGFNATSGGTSNSLFGSTNTGSGGLFSQPGNAFSANKPASFGSKFGLICSVRS